MQTTKQDAINAINTLPDNATIEDIMYRLYVIDTIIEKTEPLDAFPEI